MGQQALTGISSLTTTTWILPDAESSELTCQHGYTSGQRIITINNKVVVDNWKKGVDFGSSHALKHNGLDILVAIISTKSSYSYTCKVGGKSLLSRPGCVDEELRSVTRVQMRKAAIVEFHSLLCHLLQVISFMAYFLRGNNWLLMPLFTIHCSQFTVHCSLTQQQHTYTHTTPQIIMQGIQRMQALRKHNEHFMEASSSPQQVYSLTTRHKFWEAISHNCK